jgi:hypothetical protein
MRRGRRGQGSHGLGVPNERFLFAGVKGQVFVRGVVGRWVGGLLAMRGRELVWIGAGVHLCLTAAEATRSLTEC